MTSLDPRALADLGKHTAERMTRSLCQGLNLVDDPHQRAELMIGIIAALMDGAVTIVKSCYEEDTGQTAPRHRFLATILQDCVKHVMHDEDPHFLEKIKNNPEFLDRLRRQDQE